ncbi:post-initiation translation factor DPC29 [Aspergillus ruber CBS 135680]|uniref:DUF28 domain protein n=1 Tax=Aspergillus ruber (strain CBS 135680) TaxID=1388766 RepID=A0A017SJ66_ASPRC|nr:DUF28 domain protein [Aspergillus ruber CBS 135680]EYE96699.1 DUF28 domain protein [Aspergillus ruber CBS 135680]
MATILNKGLWQQYSRIGRQGSKACREFNSSATLFSGHNRWSTIRHDKAKNDKAKSKERQAVVKDISSATQMWGPDPKFNPRLTLLLSNAKRAEIPKAVIEAAIARGRGISVTGQALEQVTIEAMLPFSVAVVIECQTDQKARTLQDVRHAIKEVEGVVTPTTYLFEKKGRIIFEKKDGASPDDYLDQAIEAGAADIVAGEDGRLAIFTEPTETKEVGETFSKLTGLNIEELEIIWDPNKETLVEVRDKEQIKSIEDMLSTIREDASVRDIYLNTSREF